MSPNDATSPTDLTDPETNKKIRAILHDVNNGLEIIIQATYLISTIDLSDDGKQWVKLLEHGVNQVAKLNLELRDIIRKQQDISQPL